MSHFYTCDDCGQSVDGHADSHDCPGPALRRGDVAEMIQEALGNVVERMRSRAAELRETLPQATTALLLVANEIAPECDRMVVGTRGEVVVAEGLVEPAPGERPAGEAPQSLDGPERHEPGAIWEFGRSRHVLDKLSDAHGYARMAYFRGFGRPVELSELRPERGWRYVGREPAPAVPQTPAELFCALCGRECWHQTKAPTIPFLERVAAARGWAKREDLPAEFGPPPHWECDQCRRQREEMQRCQD